MECFKYMSTRVTSTGINFRDAGNNPNLQLQVTSKGHGVFSCESGAVRLRSQGLTAPVDNDEFVTKSYVDSVATGLDMKGQAQYVTIGDLAATYSQETVNSKLVYQLKGTPGVQWMHLTTDQIDVEPAAGPVPRTLQQASDDSDWFGLNDVATSNIHLPFVARTLEFYYSDGVNPAEDRQSMRGQWPTRVLVNGQTNQKENGLYWLADDGSVSNQWVLQRTQNFDGSPHGEIKPGAFIFVADGYLYKNKGFVLTNTDNVANISVTTDSSAAGDGNNIVFDGFSAAGFPVSGANIAIDGDQVGTVMDPTFDKVTIGTNSHALVVDDFDDAQSTRIARVTGSGGKCYFNNTQVVSNSNIDTTALLKATTGIRVGGAAETFTVSQYGTLTMKKDFELNATASSTGANTRMMSLINAKLQITNRVTSSGSNVDTPVFSVNHDTGNTMVKGELQTMTDVKLGVSGTTQAIWVKASGQETHALGRLVVKDPASTTLWLDIAKANGQADFKGSGAMNVHKTFKVKKSDDDTVDQFVVDATTGTTTMKGNLTVDGVQGTNSFVVAVPGHWSSFLTKIKHDAALEVADSSGNVALQVSPGTVNSVDPNVSIRSGVNFAIYGAGKGPSDATNTSSFKVDGTSGETYALGDFKVSGMFTVTSSTGSLDMEGTLDVKGNTTVETGELRVSAGAIKIGTDTNEQFTAHAPNHASDMLELKGNKFVRIKNGSDNQDRLTFTPNSSASTGLLSLEKGSSLTIKDASNVPVFTCNGTGAANAQSVMVPFVSTNCDFKINDGTGGSTLKFSVMRTTGNTTIKGTCSVQKTCTIVGDASSSTHAGLTVSSGGARIITHTGGHELEVVDTGTTQYSAPGNSHTTAYKFKAADTTTMRTDVEIGVGDADGHGSVKVHGGVLDVTSKTNAAIFAFKVNAVPTTPEIHTHSLFQGYKDDMTTQTYEIEAETGNFTGTGALKLATSWANATAETPIFHTTIDNAGTAQFNGVSHSINAPTAIQNANNLTIATGQLQMNGSKYVITNTGESTQQGDLVVTDTGAEGGAATCFQVVADGGAVTSTSSIHCHTSLSAAGPDLDNAKFSVQSSGATKVDNTLEVTGATTARGTINVYNGTGTSVLCSIASSNGSVDTEGNLNVKLNATVEEGDLTVTAGELKANAVPGGHRFSVPKTGTALGQFLGTSSTLSLAVQDDGTIVDHIQLSTGSVAGAVQTIHPLLFMKEGAILRMNASGDYASGDTFLDVHAHNKTFTLGGASGGTLALKGSDGSTGSQSNVTIDMGTGALKTQGDISSFADNTTFTAVTQVPTFYVQASSGNTKVTGTLDAHKTTTVGTATSAASLLVPNGDFRVRTDQFVVNGTAVAAFKNLDPANDKALTVSSSNTVNKGVTFEVSSDTGNTRINHGGSLELRSATTAATQRFLVNGATGDTSVTGGSFRVKSAYAADATNTTFHVDKDGNVSNNGALTVTSHCLVNNGNVTVKEQNLYVRRDQSLDQAGARKYDDTNPRYRFSVTDQCLAEFVSPSTDLGDKYFYIRDNALADKFSILGHSGDTRIKGGMFEVKHHVNGSGTSSAFLHADPQSNDGDADTHGFVSIKALGANTSFSLKNQGGANTLSIAAQTGNLLSSGTTTLNGTLTVSEETTFNTHADLGVTTKMKYAGATTFMEVKGEASKDMRLGPTSGDARLYITCGGSITSWGGAYAIRNAAGSSTMFQAAASGQITSQAGLALENSGDIVISNAGVQKFKVTGSSGAVEAQGTLSIGNSAAADDPALYGAVITAAGAVTMRSNFTLTSTDGTQNRFEIAGASGDTTITGGDLKIMTSGAGGVTPTQSFFVQASTGAVTTTGGIELNGALDLKQGTTSRVAITADGDMTLHGGDITINDGGVNESFFLDGNLGDMRIGRDLAIARHASVTGTFSCLGPVSGVSILSTSDESLKTKIAAIPGEKALEMVARLVGVTYEWRNPDKYLPGERIGFVAQNVEKVHPCFVAKDPKDGYLKVDYGSTTAILSNAVTCVAQRTTTLKEEYDQKLETVKEDCDRRLARMQEDYDGRLARMQEDFDSRLARLQEALAALGA